MRPNDNGLAPPPLRRRPRAWANLGRVLLLVFILFALAALYWFGPTEAEILSRQQELKSWVDRHLALSVAIYVLSTIFLIGVSAPIGAGWSLFGGFLFGRWIGLPVVCISITVGALLAFFSGRYLLRDVVRRWAEPRPRPRQFLDWIDRGVERGGGYYLLLLRLTPVVPYFVLNFVLGLTRMRARTFWWVSLVGMIPILGVYVNAGAAVSHLRSSADLLSTELIASLAAIMIVPWLLHGVAYLLRRRRGKNTVEG